MATGSQKKVTDSQKELEDLLIQASDDARSKVRSNVEFLENVKVKDWYEYGHDRNTGELTQGLEVFIEGEEIARRYTIKGMDAIIVCFGKPKKEGNRVIYSDVVYNELGVPASCKVPNIDINSADGTRWFSLKKL